MDSIYDNFERYYKFAKKGDKDIIIDILNEVKKYDVYDVIAKLSALNLVPENQNKATIIEPVISAILTLPKNELKSTYKISMGKFKKIIQLIESMNISLAIDPPENPFIDRVMLYENYNIFTGINYIPGYILQGFIDAIYKYTNDINNEFVEKISVLIFFILQISDKVSKGANISFENLKKYDEIPNLVIPQEQRLETLKQSIIISEYEVKRILKDEKLIDLLYCDFQNEDIENILRIDNQKFFKNPFLKDNNGNVIILSPSILVPFLVHNIIIIANKYGEKDNIINIYNNVIWKNCEKYFYRLGNKKIDEKSLNIKLENESASYKEILLSGDNKQVIIAVGIFDDGRKFSSEKVFDKYDNNKIVNVLEKRINYIIKQLKGKIEEKDIFICLIYNSFGRSMIIGYNGHTYNRPICLNPFELKCISVNEREQKFFITRYIKSKNKLLNMPQAFGELPYIDIYTNSNYSFYINDEFNPKNTMLYLRAGDDTEYMIKALKKENRMLVESYNPEYLEEVILQDETRNIYVSDSIDRNNIIVSLLVKMKNIEIWIYSEKVKDTEELNIYHSIIDAISYWIGECKKVIESKDISEKYVNIKISITGNGIDYFYNKEYDDSVNKTISIRKQNNKIILNITPDTYHCFNRNDNQEEKKLFFIIMNQILKFTHEDYKEIDKIFLPDKKQKFFTLDYQIFPYFKPIDNPQNRKINENDINELLDEIGKYIISLKKWNYGIVKEEDKNEITLLIVDYLYMLLKKDVSKLNPYRLIETMYHDIEEEIYNMMLFQKRHFNDILCYPEKKDKIWREFNENQRVTKATKFLIEYISAQPPSGSEILGESEYERLLAICSLIIEWAYNNDLFRYKMFNTPIEILKSDRIGTKKDEFDAMGITMLNARMNEFEYNSIGKWNQIIMKNEIEPDELDTAFNFENGFTFKEFLKVCYILILIGDEQESEIKKYNCEKIITKIREEIKEIDNEKVKKILNYICLEKRSDFIIPPDGDRKEDVYPWRFNRELSFTRRPLIKRGNEYIWGNRNIFHMTMFIMDLISDGKFRAKSKEMNKYIGKVSQKRGQVFNENVYNILKTFPELIVDKNLKKINRKRILDEENKDLGDIDILYIYNKNKQIVVGEVKDFKLSKNPYEIYCEYKEMFEDSEGKKSYSTKLKRRAEWIKKHIEDIKQQYNLQGDGWKIYKVFIVNEHIISKDVYRKNDNIIAVSDISLKNLTDLNEI